MELTGINCCILDPRFLEGPKSADVGIRTPKEKGAFMTYVSDIFKSKPSPMSGRIDSPKVRLDLLQNNITLSETMLGMKWILEKIVPHRESIHLVCFLDRTDGRSWKTRNE